MSDDYNLLDKEQKKAVDKCKGRIEYLISAHMQQLNKEYPEIFLSCPPLSIEVVVIQPFKLDEKTSAVLKKYLESKGWEAKFVIRGGGIEREEMRQESKKAKKGPVEGFKPWEQLRAIRGDGMRLHIDTELFRGMEVQQMFKYIDEYIDKYARG